MMFADRLTKFKVFHREASEKILWSVWQFAGGTALGGGLILEARLLLFAVLQFAQLID